jgi:hypothetical protein
MQAMMQQPGMMQQAMQEMQRNPALMQQAQQMMGANNFGANTATNANTTPSNNSSSVSGGNVAAVDDIEMTEDEMIAQAIARSMNEM